MDIEIPCGLRDAHPALPDQSNRLDLELSSKSSSLPTLPPASSNTQSRCPRNQQQANGRRFRMLAIVDDYMRECLALVPDTSLSGLRLARDLDGVIRLRGRPETIVSDNGTEFTSMAILRWCQEIGVAWHYIAPWLVCRPAI